MKTKSLAAVVGIASLIVLTPVSGAFAADQSPIPVGTNNASLIAAGWIDNVDGELYVDGPTVASVAETLDTYSGETPGYNRTAQFGAAWVTKIDGCDTRNRILQRDFVSFTTREDGCTVTTGVFDDPYTGTVIDFQRTNYPTTGEGNSSAVQIDHVVPLKAGWNGGASAWSQETRIAFANDPVNLWASDGRSNSSKGDKLYGEWQPSNPAFQCEYVAQQVWVLDAYDIAVTQVDKTALVSAASDCVLPASSGGEVVDPETPVEPTDPETPVEPTPVDPETPVTPEVPTDPGTLIPGTGEQTDPVATDDRICADFATREEAQAAYEAGNLDLDGNDKDGIACESLPSGASDTGAAVAAASSEKELAYTGGSAILAYVAGGVALAGLIAAAVIAVLRRRSRVKDESTEGTDIPEIEE